MWISCCRPAKMSFGVMYPVALFRRTLLLWSTYPLTRRRASSSDNGVPGRMDSALSDLCQRSIFSVQLRSFAPSRMISMSVSVIDSRTSQFTI